MANIDQTDGAEHMSSEKCLNALNIFQLNEDCLRELFKYCSCADLFNLCIVSKQLESLVVEYGIQGKIIDFSEFVDFDIPEVFKIFGKKITKIKIGEKDFRFTQSAGMIKT